MKITWSSPWKRCHISCPHPNWALHSRSTSRRKLETFVRIWMISSSTLPCIEGTAAAGNGFLPG
jgi:hypothetical protein